MPYYIIEKLYVGPNQNESQHIDADHIIITTTPATDIRTGQPKPCGHCGTLNDWLTIAHGSHENLHKVEQAVKKHLGELREQELSEYDRLEGIQRRYKIGGLIPMTLDESADYIYQDMINKVSAYTTDEQLDALVKDAQDEAASHGYTLDTDVLTMLKEYQEECQRAMMEGAE